MGYAERMDGFWRARYRDASGRYPSVKDADGRVVRFRTKREAEAAADDAEAAVRAASRSSLPGSGRRITFGEWVNVWYGRIDLAGSTMRNYRRHTEDHLLPEFGDLWLDEVTQERITAWERKERAVPYAESSIRTWRATLHLILEDALADGWVTVNQAKRRRGRGKRTGRARRRGPEKVITTALGVLLIAERAALLSGRDDEFVLTVHLGFTGSRWGESVGLEPQYVRDGLVRVEWQLYEHDDGTFERCPPKDESRRDVRVCEWHTRLLRGHLAGRELPVCSCHGRRYVFSGHRTANTTAHRKGARLADVARTAGVSVGTASDALNRPDRVAPETRARVADAVRELGYVPGVVDGVLAPHPRRNGFATWVFQPAATGWFPPKAPRPARPVPLLADPWPGVPLRGSNNAGRATACWLPIARGLTPHGLRHSYKTMMLELGTPQVLMDEQLGHLDTSIQGRYSHVTARMVDGLLAGLTQAWEAALDARREMCAGSPVRVLDDLLRGR